MSAFRGARRLIVDVHALQAHSPHGQHTARFARRRAIGASARLLRAPAANSTHPSQLAAGASDGDAKRGSAEGAGATAAGRFADLNGLGPRRLYSAVDVVDVASLPKAAGGADGGGDSSGFAVRLDGRPLYTPRRRLLRAPTRALAVGVAAEWAQQRHRVRPSSMPLTALLTTALDIVPEHRARIVDTVLRYLQTDTVCYRAEFPASLAEEQLNTWQPLLRAFERRYGVALNTTTSVVGLRQPEGAQIDAVVSRVGRVSDVALAALDSATASAKSLVIALAMFDGELSPEDALVAARVEEDFQARVWGEVQGGHDVDRADTSVRLHAAAYVAAALRAA